MRYNWLSAAVSVLSAWPLCPFATPLSPHWDDMRAKHAWKAVPANWETLGLPPSDTTIDLYVALKPHRENALIDALYQVSDPGLPKYVPHYSAHGCTHVNRCAVADMGYTCPRSRSPSSWLRTRTHLSLSTPGLNITAFPLPPSQRHTAATG